jgi:hypothetical protein
VAKALVYAGCNASGRDRSTIERRTSITNGTAYEAGKVIAIDHSEAT